jgi:hypothetical protein
MKADTFRVVANGVEVGILPLAQYEAIQAEVKRDWRLYLAQALNVGGTVLHTTVWLFKLTPIVWFWLWIAAMIADPGGFATAIVLLQTNAVAVVPAALSTTLQISVACSLLAFGFLIMFRSHFFGLANVFERALNARIGQALNVPSWPRAEFAVLPKLAPASEARAQQQH